MPALATTLHEKVWGSPNTEPWCKNPDGRKIGEIWFAASPQFPLLVKLLFTSDRLSVQVHPDDVYARQHEGSAGKTEMWHVVRAEPDAHVALGLKQAIDKTELRRAAESGAIEHLLNWIPARQGETFFVPAGTIHAVGGGLVLCEVQQLSDITYRLYDYGRPRPLHLDRGIEVANSGRWTPQPADCDYFRTRIFTVNGLLTLPTPANNTLCVVLEGNGTIGSEAFVPGEAFEFPRLSAPVKIQSPQAVVLVTSEP